MTALEQQHPEPWTFAARWIMPVGGAPLAQGTITIAGDRIVEVAQAGQRQADRDLGNVAILPGLVNAHTHLDLTSLRGRMPPTANFPDWLRAVVRHRRTLTTAQIQSDTRAGLAEALAYGTTLLGDISGQGLSWSSLAESPIRAAVFYELLGLSRTRAHQAWAAACQWLSAHPATATCRPGFSPHAPYSVRRSLFRAAANLARRQQIPLAIHSAETRSELELLQSHGGPFRAFLDELGVWDRDGLVTGPGELLQLHHDLASIQFVHGNYLDPRAPFPSGGTVVYCPRTHTAFGHESHPFESFMANGVNIALGTDSLASNPDLDILAEARFVHQHCPHIPGETLLRLVTLNGAAALGFAMETGSLAAGKSADLVVLPLPNQDTEDPYRLIWESSLPVQAVLARGRWVYQAS